MSDNNDKEFTIRVTGAAPPPLPSTATTTKKGKRGGGRGKSTKTTALQQDQQQRRYNLRLRPSSSLDQMRKDVFALFNVPTSSTQSYQMSFLGGFPPKELNQDGKNTVHELGIRPSESLIVKFSLRGGAAAAEGGQATKAAKTKRTKNKSTASAKQPASNNDESMAEASSATNGGSSSRPKRASAMAATANFADVIAAQDAILNQDKSTKSSSPKKVGKVTTYSAGNIAGFTGNTAGKRAGNTGRQAAAKKPKIEGAGYRLSDGKSIAGSSPSKKKKSAAAVGFESKDDIAGTLLSSLSGGGKGGNAGKFLRAAMKNAVHKSYEASRAAVRVAAVNLGEYGFEKVKGGSVVEGGGVVLGVAKDHEAKGKNSNASCNDDGDALGRTLYTVSYSKGMEGRGRYEEQVEIIALVAVKAVLEQVYSTASSNDPNDSEDDEPTNPNADKDGRLRPVMIAQLSPRVFWSLVYHCYQESLNANNPTTYSSVEDMLRLKLPQLDWAHLDRGGRKRVLSEKAKENLRQEKMQSIINTEGVLKTLSSQDGDNDEGVKIIEEIQQIAENNDGGNGLNERERRARAAMARFGNTEYDRKAPPEAMKPTAKITDDWTLVTPMDDDIDELIECIMEGSSAEDSTSTYNEENAKDWAGALLGSIPNWRVLANSNVDEILSKLPDNQLSREIVETWIDAAQERTHEEIMLEILDGDNDALEALTENARSSCPRGLKFWQHAPALLIDAMQPKDKKATGNWTEVDVVRWIDRAKKALSICTWLEEFTTSFNPKVATW